MNPQQLRNEADSAERLARLVSFLPDKARLQAAASELRRQADGLEARSWRPRDRAGAREPSAQ